MNIRERQRERERERERERKREISPMLSMNNVDQCVSN